MELLVTLRNPKYINKLRNVCDGFIVGGLFSTGYNYSTEEIQAINDYCKNNNFKLYLTIENFISEDEKMQLYTYFDFIKTLDLAGIYFHDLGVYEIGKEYGMSSKLIYDGQTVLCNSMDVAFYMSRGIDGVVLSRELTLDELDGILKNNPKCCDVVIYGHQRLSYSKRKFLTNYFKEINSQYDYLNSKSLYLVEEKRDYKMPIIEDSNGTKIYTDYIFEMFKEIPNLRDNIKRGIVDTLFVDDSIIITVLRDYKRVTNENAQFILENLSTNRDDTYSTGFLHQKTNITKDE